MTKKYTQIKFEEDDLHADRLKEEGAARSASRLREERSAHDRLHEEGEYRRVKAGDPEDPEFRFAGRKSTLDRESAANRVMRARAARSFEDAAAEHSEDSADEASRQAVDATREAARRSKYASRRRKRTQAEPGMFSDGRKPTGDSCATAEEHDYGRPRGDADGGAQTRLKEDGGSSRLRQAGDSRVDGEKLRRSRRKRESPFSGVLKRRAMASASRGTKATAARRAARAARKATFGIRAAIGALATGVAVFVFGLAAVGIVLMLLTANDPTPEPSVHVDLPEAVEIWRGECRQACIDILGDEKWTDLMLAMMAQESGGNLGVLCFPGAVQRQDIMQACEGAYGSWILHGGGPYNLVACTPRASIYAGAAELKQNLSLWGAYLGGIEVHEVEKIELVVQGYNFGAQGWFNWNKRHGYKTYTLAHAQNYSDSVMPAGAKGTPSHAEKVMQYYPYALSGAADGATTVARAYQEIGKPYLWGACGPASYDCSGLVSYCLTGKYERLGTTETFAAWKRVADPVPGDICLNSHHCGIYVGAGKMIHAPHTGDVVKISNVHMGMYYVRY